MPIDWFTVAAQAINFIILVVLLRRFLYGPIVRAMERREQRIADRLADADAKVEEADAQRARLEGERRELRQRRSEMVESAKREAADHRESLLKQARAESDRMKQQWARSLERQADGIAEDIGVRLVQLSLEASERVLGELASESLSDRATFALAERLRSLDDESRRVMREAWSDEGGTILSATELSDESWQMVCEALAEIGLDPERVERRVDPSLVLGVEVRTGGRKVGWSAAGVLERSRRALEEHVRRASHHVSERVADPKPGRADEDEDGLRASHEREHAGAAGRAGREEARVSPGDEAQHAR